MVWGEEVKVCLIGFWVPILHPTMEQCIHTAAEISWLVECTNPLGLELSHVTGPGH